MAGGFGPGFGSGFGDGFGGEDGEGPDLGVNRYYGVAAVGGNIRATDVTERGSTGGSSAVVELRINESVYGNKLAVIYAIKSLLRHIESPKETSPIS